MLRGLVTAWRTLTAVPIPGRDTDSPVQALPWFPVVGLVLGTVPALLSMASDILGLVWPLALGTVLVLAGILLTRGLHLDGVADWADGFWGGRDREHTLRIMKDPCVGSFGTIALVIVLLAKWVGYVGLALDGNGWRWIAAAYVLSRTMQVDLACGWNYARPEGGTGAAFIRDAGWRQWFPAFAVALVMLATLSYDYWRLLVFLPLTWGFTRLFGGWCQRKVGGVTGDLLGAASELIETGVLFVGACLVTS